jgi:hypothetical protein
MASNLKVTELDFFQIKENFKTYLKAQQDKGKFVDYDFDGSGMSVFLDILAYNTHYNAVNANMAMNEVFLDSAERRNNVVSLAKMLSYVPRSLTAASATLEFVVNEPTNSPVTLTIDRGTTFTTTILDKQYSFVTLESSTITPQDETVTTIVGGSSLTTVVPNVYRFRDIKVYEGELRSIQYTVDSFDDGLYFEIPDENVDITTLVVKVKSNSSSSKADVFTLATDFTSVTADTQAYFLQEGVDGKYEVYFGDGVVGKSLEGGNVVMLEWLSTNGVEANGAAFFVLADTIEGNTNVDISVINKSIGGAEREDVASIKFNAPLSYLSQNRCVTAEDYKAMIINNYGDVETVTVWGGEENDPPQYGKAYVCIKPKNADFLDDTQKKYIVDNILRTKNVVSIAPVIVDAEYTYLYLDVFFKYNPNLTDSSSSQLKTIVNDVIVNYNDTELKKFDGVYRQSKLLGLVDKSDTGILSSTIRVYMQKRLVPTLDVAKRYEMKFSAPIFGVRSNPNEPILKSSGFTHNGYTAYIEDRVLSTGEINPFEAEGATHVLQMYRIINNAKVVTNSAVGYINANSGLVVVTNLMINAVGNGGYVSFTTIPASDDIAPKREQLLEIDPALITITPSIDTIATGGSQAGIGYTTTNRFV